MKQRTDSQGVPYSYLVDNIKVLLIFLVVFNHIIAFQLVKVDMIVRYVWYAITIFHMPAFVFMSGYLSKKPQDVLEECEESADSLHSWIQSHMVCLYMAWQEHGL